MCSRKKMGKDTINYHLQKVLQKECDCWKDRMIRTKCKAHQQTQHAGIQLPGHCHET